MSRLYKTQIDSFQFISLKDFKLEFDGNFPFKPYLGVSMGMQIYSTLKFNPFPLWQASLDSTPRVE